MFTTIKNKLKYLRFEFCLAVSMESTIFWDVMLCSFEAHCCFKDPNCLHFHAQKENACFPAFSTYSFIVKMKVYDPLKHQ
jgi:hypothetical protein